MKIIKPVFLFLIIAIVFAGCAVQDINVQVLYPPYQVLPDHIHHFVVMNGSYVDSTQKTGDVFISVLTGKAVAGDKLGSEDCITAFNSEINSTSAFQSVIPNQHTFGRGMMSGIPKPLDWQQVHKLCRDNKADALVLLEQFSATSDAVLTGIKSITNIAATGGTPVYPINYHVAFYWRIYDTLTNTTLDEYGDVLHSVYNNNVPFQPLPTQEVRNRASDIGNDYAKRFLSLYYWEPREFFKKGSSDFEIASRKAIVNEWEGAMEIWRKHAGDDDPKIAGRACYNMAVGCEVTGKIEEAKTWAQRAYTDYNLKRAREYLMVLNNRPYGN